MSTSYPGALDSFVNPTATDTLDSATVPHAAQHDNINDAMAAVQVTLGVNPQGGSATVVARLTALDSTVAGKAATNQTMYVGLAINRSSASQTLTGVSIDGNAATATSATSATTAGSVTNGVYTNVSNTFTTGTQIIATGADGTVGFRIKRNSATQTANLLEVTQSDGTTILAKIDSAGGITTASDVTLGSAGSAAGSVKFGTTGGYQLLSAGTGASNTQTLPTGASGTLLNTNTTSIPNVTTANGLTSASSLATVGTIGSGTWQGSVIQPTYGGTGSTYGTTMVGRSYLSATRTKAVNDTSVEAIFYNSAGSAVQYFNVDADTSYFFDGYFIMTKGTTAAAPSMSVIYFDGSGSALTPQAVSLTANYASSGAFISTITVTAANTATNGLATSTLTGIYTRFQGFIRTHASTAGKINFGGGVSVITTGTTPTFNIGSFVQISKIGTGAATNFGNWTS